MSYNELSVEERVAIQLGQAQGFSQRRITCLINRAPSTVSRELRRNQEACSRYSVRTAQHYMQVRRRSCRPKRKLLPGKPFVKKKTTTASADFSLRRAPSPFQAQGEITQGGRNGLRSSRLNRGS